MKLVRVAVALTALFPPHPAAAQQSLPVKIVGIGATTCSEFIQQAKANPPSQREYLAWVQGYLSGIVVARPAGIDEGIDLNPKTFPLAQQVTFIREYCLNAPSDSFADAVEALFKKLKGVSST